MKIKSKTKSNPERNNPSSDLPIKGSLRTVTGATKKYKANDPDNSLSRDEQQHNKENIQCLHHPHSRDKNPPSASSSSLRSENERRKKECLKYDSLRRTNENLKKELNDARATLKRQSVEMRKGASSLQSHLNATLAEKNELSQSVSEDCKELKNNVEEALRERDGALREKEISQNMLEEESEAAAARGKKFRDELSRLQSIHDEAIVEATDRKEKELKREFEEKMGGMEEIIEQTRAENSVLEEEKLAIIKEANQDKTKFDSKIRELTERNSELEQEKMEAIEMISSIQNNVKNQQNKTEKLRSELDIFRKKNEEDSNNTREQFNIRLTEASMELKALKSSHKVKVTKDESSIASWKIKHQQCDDRVLQLQKKVAEMTKNYEDKEHDAERSQTKFSAEIDRHKNLCESLENKLEIRLADLSMTNDLLEQNTDEMNRMKNDSFIKEERHVEQSLVWEAEQQDHMRDIQEIRKICKRLKQEKFELLEETQHLENQTRYINAEKEKALESLGNEMATQVKNTKKSLEICQGEKASLEKQLKEIETTATDNLLRAKTREDELISKVDKNQAQLNTLKASIESMKIQMKNIVAERDSRISQNEQLKDILGEKERALQEKQVLENEIKKRFGKASEDHTIQLSKLQQKIDYYEKETIAASKKMDEMKQSQESCEEEVNKLKNSIIFLEEEKTNIEGIHQTSERKLLYLEDELSNAKGEKKVAKEELSDAKNAISEIMEENSSLIQKGTTNVQKYKETIHEMRDIIQDQKDALTKSHGSVDEEQNKYSDLCASSQRAIGDLSVDLKICQEARVREKEKLSKESESSKKSLAEAEEEIDILTQKHKNATKQTSKEYDRCQQIMRESESNCDSLKMQLEGKRREISRTTVELSLLKEKYAGVEKRIHSSEQMSGPKCFAQNGKISDDNECLENRIDKILSNSLTLETFSKSGFEKSPKIMSAKLKSDSMPPDAICRQESSQSMRLHPYQETHAERQSQSKDVRQSGTEQKIEEPDAVINRTVNFLARRRKPSKSLSTEPKEPELGGPESKNSPYVINKQSTSIPKQTKQDERNFKAAKRKEVDMFPPIK